MLSTAEYFMDSFFKVAQGIPSEVFLAILAEI